ncbi:MAG: glutamine-hydrolyzing asparagine synthase [Chlorobi bacterium OLB5]|nr:MAG: glutamine-hydrolyzing asparagine synthase [Chlorobi bacterium OLB5]
MCGITGIFNINGEPVSVNILQKMTDSLSHRGPDGEGVWTEGFAGLGHRRLAIIDLSPLGSQPMQNDSGDLIITYNGELYNYMNLKVELEALGYKFHSKTDTEVILKSFEAWGSDCVHKFNGMFAFAIWDRKKSAIFIARDRYGIKPLYYFFKNGKLIFASEIKALLQHPEISVKVNIKALNEYFSFQNIFSDLTLFKDIMLLPPAGTISLGIKNNKSLKINQYWDFCFRNDHSLNEQEYTEELERLFTQAVNRQLISDVEIGSYLSGGMDSGSITSIAAKNFKNLKTFTCGFDLSSASGLELGFDERIKAEFLSNIYKTEHYEIVLKAGDMERVMHDLIWYLEDLRIGQSYPNFYVARLASKFVKVILSGSGGDELFAGYPWRYYRAVVNDDSEHYIEKYYRYWQRLIPDSYKPKFYNKEIYPEILSYQCKDIFRNVLENKLNNEITPEEYVNHSLYFEAKTFLHGILLVEDKLSMAHSLETRVPFLDNDLVDFAMKVPITHKLKNLKEVIRINENIPGPKTERFFEQNNDGKIILRKALMKYVPESYATGLKQGFSAPDASWFKGESNNYIKNILYDKRARIYEYIQPKMAQQLMDEHFSGKTNRRLLIWSLLCFEWWNRIFDPK